MMEYIYLYASCFVGFVLGFFVAAILMVGRDASHDH